jgi:Spy/CpxP family protein refolding chaperone
MNKNRFAKTVSVAAGFTFLLSAPGLIPALVVLPAEAQTPSAALQGPQPSIDSFPANDFAGLNLTQEQKAEIEKIHRDAETRKAIVTKDEKLSQDQKDAMILGYSRLEYGANFKVLTPEQQKQVRQKIRARHAPDPAAQKKQAPRN